MSLIDFVGNHTNNNVASILKDLPIKLPKSIVILFTYIMHHFRLLLLLTTLLLLLLLLLAKEIYVRYITLTLTLIIPSTDSINQPINQ